MLHRLAQSFGAGPTQPWLKERVILQGPLDGPCRLLPGHFQPKYVRIRFWYLPHQFHTKLTHKTIRNMQRHRRPFQGKPFERHGHS